MQNIFEVFLQQRYMANHFCPKIGIQKKRTMHISTNFS